MIHFNFLDYKKTNTMLLVHGFSQNYKIFNKQTEYFNKYFNLLLVDLRGHGKSSFLDGPFGVEEYSDDIQFLLKELNLNNIIYWGTHTGSAIGLNLYFRNPKLISCLILEGTVIPGYDTPAINKNINRSKEVSLKYGIESARKDWLLNSEWFDFMRENPDKTRYKEHQDIVNLFHGKPWMTKESPRDPKKLLKEIHKIKIPVLAYNGEYDMKEFLVMTDELKINQNIHICKIPESGGFPLWENPSYVNKLVHNFLKSLNFCNSN